MGVLCGQKPIDASSGWDAIDGGQQTCTHAWRLLTGCQDQYEITLGSNGKFQCNKANLSTVNDPHVANPKSSIDEWPQGRDSEWVSDSDPIDAHQLFHRMIEWEDTNFMMMGATE